MHTKPVPFGNKMCWLAIKNASATQLVKDLDIIAPTATDWQEGIQAVYQDFQQELMNNMVYLTPDINGWTFIIGYSLPSPEPETADILLELLAYLSSKYKIALGFGTNRISEHHHWIKFVNGKLIRGFACSEGTLLLNEGKPTQEESFIDFSDIINIQNPDFNGDVNFENLPDETTVLKIAQLWSINPLKINSINSSGTGFLGKIAEDMPSDNIPGNITRSHYPDNSTLIGNFKSFFFNK